MARSDQAAIRHGLEKIGHTPPTPSIWQNWLAITSAIVMFEEPGGIDI